MKKVSNLKGLPEKQNSFTQDCSQVSVFKVDSHAIFDVQFKFMKEGKSSKARKRRMETNIPKDKNFDANPPPPQATNHCELNYYSFSNFHCLSASKEHGIL